MMSSGEKFSLSKKFSVIGHRGCGVNMLQSSDPRVKAIKENSIRSINAAANYNLDWVEFDVQVTKDGFPVIFHDIFIFTPHKGVMIEKRVTELTLDELRSFGPQMDSEKVGKPMFRKIKDGRIFEWKVEEDDHLCTLEELFKKVNHSLGFNIEFKFDDHMIYKEEIFVNVIQVVMKVVSKYAKDRPIMFSTFQPDAVMLVRKLQNIYPVFFLTNGGSEIYLDMRRNSLDEAIKICLIGGLQGIVSEVKAVLRNPGAIKKIQDSKLAIITYGQLNSLEEVVYMQYKMGVEGVIVDLVKEITKAASEFVEGKDTMSPCSEDQIAYFLSLTPEFR